MKPFIAILLVLLILPVHAARGEARIGLVPFQNVSGVRDATGHVMFFVKEALEKKGLKISPWEPLGRFLKEERIRFQDFLPTAEVRKMAQLHGLQGIVTGTILTYREGRNPQVGIPARLVSADGSLLWQKVVALTGDEQEGILGLGKVDTIRALLPVAASRLVETFRAGGETPSADTRLPRRLPLSKPLFYRSPSLGAVSPLRIAVLPIGNYSPNRNAGGIIQDLVVSRLSGRKGISVTEPGDVREGLIAEGFRVVDRMDSAQLRAIAKRLGTRYFLSGVIYQYERILGYGGVATPAIEFYFMILDAETGKIVWSSRNLRKGTDYRTVLQFGQIRNLVSLSEQVIEEMVSTIRK